MRRPITTIPQLITPSKRGLLCFYSPTELKSSLTFLTYRLEMKFGQEFQG